jgi:hypothetical protein
MLGRVIASGARRTFSRSASALEADISIGDDGDLKKFASRETFCWDDQRLSLFETDEPLSLTRMNGWRRCEETITATLRRCVTKKPSEYWTSPSLSHRAGLIGLDSILRQPNVIVIQRGAVNSHFEMGIPPSVDILCSTCFAWWKSLPSLFFESNSRFSVNFDSIHCSIH